MVARRQAHLVGVTDNQLRSRVTSGSLESLGPNAYRLFGAPRSPHAELLGLILDVGPNAYATGRTAAALCGFDTFALESPFHVVIARGRRVRRPDHHVHRSMDLDAVDLTRIDGVPSITPARALIELARTEPPTRLAAALDSGLRDRRFTEERLHERIVALRSQGKHGIPTLLAVIEGAEISRGGHSWLERRFLELAAHVGLPRPLAQQVLATSGDTIVRVDFRFPGTPIVVETLGYRYHGTRAQLQRDATRLNALLDQGLLPYQFTYDQVTGDPHGVVAQLRGALRRAAA